MPIPCSSSLLALIQENLSFNYVEGAVTPLPVPHTTGWRQLPYHLVAQSVNGWVKVRFRNGHEYEVKHREALFVARGTPHIIDKISTGPSVSRWAHFRVRLFGGLDALDLMDPPTSYPRSLGDRLGDICEKIAQSRPPSGAFALGELANMKSLGFEMVALLAENATPRPNASRLLSTSQRLTRVFQLLHSHPEQPHTLVELAGLACLSPSRFHALFVQSMGMPPLKYLQHLRMDQARMLLLTTDLAVREISERIGLENPFYFSRLFRKTTGSSPQQYRRQTLQGAWRNAGGK